jgi:hypothetical protein
MYVGISKTIGPIGACLAKVESPQARDHAKRKFALFGFVGWGILNFKVFILLYNLITIIINICILE